MLTAIGRERGFAMTLYKVGPIYRTRFDGLHYTKVGPDWRFIDVASGTVVGPMYPSRAELLSALPLFAATRGYE